MSVRAITGEQIVAIVGIGFLGAILTRLAADAGARVVDVEEAGAFGVSGITLGILFAVYGRWSAKLGWKGNDTTSLRFLQPGEVGITKAQKSTAWFFLVVSILFLIQATVLQETARLLSHEMGYRGV